MPHSTDLERSVQLAQSGDLEAFELVIRETARALRSYLALFVTDLSVIDDLTQECYVHVFEHFSDYTPGTSFIAYMKTIGKFRALSHIRSNERKRSAHQRYVLAIHERLAVRCEALPGEEEGTDRLKRLRSCIASLGTFAQQIIQLRYFEARPIEAIAESLGRTTGSVTVAMFRTRRQLAECLGSATPVPLSGENR